MALPHVVFMNIDSTGHVNPTLPVVERLVSLGCKVTYFVDAQRQAVVEAAGAAWMPFRYASHDFTGILRRESQLSALSAAERSAVGLLPDGAKQHFEWFKEHLEWFPLSVLYNSQLVLPQLLDDVRSLKPLVSAIVCDPILPCGRVVAHVLGVTPISVLSDFGPGVTTVPEEVEKLPWVEGPRQWIRREYGIDVFEDAALLEFYSPVLNLVNTVDDLYAPPKSEKQIRRFGDAPFRCVGALLDPKVNRIGYADIANSTGELALRAAQDAKKNDRRVVLVSLGTVATGPNWTTPFGVLAAADRGNDERPEGTKSLMEHTGKDFCLFFFRTIFEVAASDPGMLAIVHMGPHMAEALEALSEPPSNVVMCEFVPQLELLPLCHAFVTHGGANSINEALSFGVPLCVVPIFADQPANADAVARIGAGVSFRNPLLAVSGASLSDALGRLEGIGGEASPSTFTIAAREASKSLAAAEGAGGAADAVLDAARGADAARTAEAAAATKEADETLGCGADSSLE